MTNAEMFKPGDKAPRSGRYRVVSLENGRPAHEERVVTLEAGERFPPTPSEGLGYKPEDAGGQGQGQGTKVQGQGQGTKGQGRGSNH